MTDIRTADRTLIQAADGWPATDAGWDSYPDWVLDSATETAGPIIGTATARQHYGSVALPNAAPSSETADLLAEGFVCRILLQDDTGTITIDGENWRAIWWGVITGIEEEPDQAAVSGSESGTLIMQMRDLRHLLQSIQINRGWETTASGPAPVMLTRFPALNAIPGGDCYTGSYTINGTSTVSVHKRGGANRTTWTAAKAVKLLLAGFGRQQLPPSFSTVGDLTWTLSDTYASGALDYELPRMDLHGMSVLQALGAIIRAERGLTWRLRVIGSTCYVYVHSGLPTAITVGSYSAPAASSAARCTLTAAGSVWVRDVRLAHDASQVADLIQVQGKECPRVALMLRYLVAGGGELTVAADGDGGYRFGIDDSWPGYSRSTTGTEVAGLRHGLTYTTTSDASYGTGGYTGARVADASTYAGPNAGSYELDPTLPIPANQSAADAISLADLIANGEMPVKLYIRDGSNAIDITSEFSLRVESCPPAIIVGSNEADRDRLDGWLGDDGELHVVLSVREPNPLMVSWLRPVAEWVRSTPVVRVIEVAGIEEWIVCDAIRFGETLTATAGITVRSDLDRLREILAYARQLYAWPTSTVTWIDQGRIDWSVPGVSNPMAAGCLLEDVVLSDSTAQIDAIITSRRWMRRPDGCGYDTHYTTEALRPSIEVAIG